MVLLVDPACYTEYERQTLANYIDELTAEGGQTAQRSYSGAVKQRSGLSIVATHGHLDHLWGAAWACERYHTEVYMHEADIAMADAMQQQYDLFGIPAKAEPFPIKSLTSEGGQQLIANSQQPMAILPTPGHTPGSVCLYWPSTPNSLTPNPPILISGDTLFCMGFGRTDLPGGSYSQLMHSLNILFNLPSDVIVYPGHGQKTTIGAEKRGY